MIVCGTDFSKSARDAADVAALIAKPKGEGVHLVHAVENAGLSASSAKVWQLLEAKLHDQLLEEAERLRRQGVKVKEEIMPGSAVKALVRAAGRSKVRLLVLGSLGQAAGRFLVGSVPERVAALSPVSTLVVRDADPLKAWLQGKRPLRVGIGYDFSTSAEEAVRWVAEFGKTAPYEVVVIHVYWPLEERLRLGLPADFLLSAPSPELQETLQRQLEEHLAGRFDGLPARLCVRPAWGRIDTPLLQTAREEQIDLLVVGTHQRRGLSRVFLGSVSRSVLHQSPHSVVVAPIPKRVRRQPASISRVRRVLVATDFSELADRVIPHAYAAVRPGGTVCLLHVVEPYEYPNPLIAGHYDRQPMTPHQRRKVVAEAPGRLRSLAPPEASNHGIRTEVEVIQSRRPAQVICQAAERLDADLICLGTHGRSGLAKGFMGSVAQEVMRRTQRPVLLIREPKR